MESINRDMVYELSYKYDLCDFNVYYCIDVLLVVFLFCFFFFQAEDGIRDRNVTGVQTCALPIFERREHRADLLPLAATGPLDALAARSLAPERGARGDEHPPYGLHARGPSGESRSEERRVGKECRSRRSPDHEKKKKKRKKA